MDTTMSRVMSPDIPVRAIVADEKGEIWALTSRGLEHWDGSKFSIVDKSFIEIPCFHEGKPFPCSQNPEFSEFKFFAPHQHWEAQFPVDSKRFSEAVDAQGHHWVCNGSELFVFEVIKAPKLVLGGVSTRGLKFYKDRLYINSYHGFYEEDHLVWGTMRKHTGSLVTWRDTLYSFCHGLHQWPGRADSIDGDFFFGTADVMLSDNWSRDSTSIGILLDGTVYNDRIWLCGSDGVGIWEGKQEITPVRIDKKATSLVEAGGKLYALLKEGGLMVMTNEREFDVVKGVPHGIVYNDVIQLSKQGGTQDMLAFATSRGIAFCDLEGNDFRLISTEDGLASSVVCALQEDEDGRIWASTYAGLARYDRETEQIDVFFKHIEFNRWSKTYNPETDLHYWGSINGVYEVDLASIPTVEDMASRHEKANQIGNMLNQILVALAIGLSLLIGLIIYQYHKLQNKYAKTEKDIFIANLESKIIANLPNASVEILAEAENISARTLYRRMEIYEVKPGEILRETKLKRAQDLLRTQPQMTLKEIAAQVGYSEIYLSRLLKEGDAS